MDLCRLYLGWSYCLRRILRYFLIQRNLLIVYFCWSCVDRYIGPTNIFLTFPSHEKSKVHLRSQSLARKSRYFIRCLQYWLACLSASRFGFHTGHHHKQEKIIFHINKGQKICAFRFAIWMDDGQWSIDCLWTWSYYTSVSIKVYRHRWNSFWGNISGNLHSCILQVFLRHKRNIDQPQTRDNQEEHVSSEDLFSYF